MDASGMAIPDELIEQLGRGEVILFIGAGISMNAGLPGWIELVQPLSQAVGSRWPSNIQDINTEHLLTIARYYENRFGRNALIRFLQDKLNSIAVIPSTAHYLLTLLPVKLVFTTNYDNLIERSYQEVQVPFHCVVSEPELPYWKEGQVQIVKLCGDIARPESIQFTRSDFNTYVETHSRLIETLRTTLEKNTALFLGYGIHDPFINQIWDSIARTFGRHQRTSYAVFFDLPALEEQDLRTRNIHPINIGYEGKTKQIAFLEFLTNLIKLSRKVETKDLEKVLKQITDPIAVELLRYM